MEHPSLVNLLKLALPETPPPSATMEGILGAPNYR